MEKTIKWTTRPESIRAEIYHANRHVKQVEAGDALLKFAEWLEDMSDHMQPWVRDEIIDGVGWLRVQARKI